jgi:replication factor C subunit 3/5
MEVEEVGSTTQTNEEKRTEFLPWVEKYRPKNFDELVSHSDIISTLVKLIESRKLPHLLFYGPPGTGKTSTIQCVARKMFGDTLQSYQAHVLELNASDERKIQTVRDTIKDFASTKTMGSGGGNSSSVEVADNVKLVILDEADAMTHDAQAALRRIIEKYTRTTRFCLICNHINKIIPAIQSRCTRFRFAPLPDSDLRGRLEWILTQEGVRYDSDGLKAAIKLGHGDMRRCLNILQATYMAHNQITEDLVYTCTGHPHPRDIRMVVDWMWNSDFSVALRNVLQLKGDRGLALQDLLREVHTYVMYVQMEQPVRIQLLKDLADVEYHLAWGSNEKIQTGAMVSAFQLTRDKIAGDDDVEDKGFENVTNASTSN